MPPIAAHPVFVEHHLHRPLWSVQGFDDLTIPTFPDRFFGRILEWHGQGHDVLFGTVTVQTSVFSDPVNPGAGDFFGSEDAYVAVFDAFVERIAPGGALVVCTDDPGAAALADRTDALGIRVLRYGSAGARRGRKGGTRGLPPTRGRMGERSPAPRLAGSIPFGLATGRRRAARVPFRLLDPGS